MKQTFKAWLRAWMRPSALAMAATIVLTSFPTPLAPASVAAPIVVTAQAADPSIMFYQVDDNGRVTTTNQAELITGHNITIRENSPDGEVATSIVIQSTNNPSFEAITSVPGSTTGSSNGAITIGSLRDKLYRDITFHETFDLQTGLPEVAGTTAKYANAFDVYSISAVFTRRTRDGEAFLTPPGTTNQGNPPLRNVTCLNRELTVVTESKILIQCTTGEDQSPEAFFEVVTDTAKGGYEPTGVFSGIDIASMGTGGDLPRTSATQSDVANRKIRLNLRSSGSSSGSSSSSSSGSGSGSGTQDPDLEIDYSMVNVTNPKDDDPPGTVPIYDNYIKATTKFEIVYRPYTTPGITLTVMTPQYVINQIETEITRNDGVRANDYIRFASGDNMTYITKNFEALQRLSRYNGDFQIDWEWTHDPAPDHNGNDNDATDRTIRFGDTKENGWQSANIIRGTNNSYGSLSARVSYWFGGNLNMETQTDKAPYNSTIPTWNEVVVRGTGIPPTVQRYSQRKGDGKKGPPPDDESDEYTFKYEYNDIYGGDPAPPPLSDYLKLKSPIEMDAYQGGMGDDYSKYETEPAGPFEYILHLNMGDKNGTASYAVFNAADYENVVKFQTRNSQGGWVDYTPGAQIANPSIDTSEEETVELKITALQRDDTRQKIVNFTVSFYIPDGNNVPQLYSEQFSASIRVYNSAPNQDATLSGVSFRDAYDANGRETSSGELIPFSFERETYTYDGDNALHIPYRIKSFRFTASLNNGLGSKNPMTFVVQDARTGRTGSADNIQGISYGGTYSDSGYPINSGAASYIFDFDDDDDHLGVPYNIIITSPCQDPRSQYWQTYTIQVVHDAPSEDSTLSGLSIYLDGSSENLLPDFIPGKTEYDIWIPYSAQMLQILYEKNNSQAELGYVTALAGNQRSENRIVEEDTGKPWTLVGRSLPNDPKEWLKQVKGHFDKLDRYSPNVAGLITLRIPVTSERTAVVRDSGGPVDDPYGDYADKVYYVRLNRLPASNDPKLAGFTVTDTNENERAYTPGFNPATQVYTLDVPFSVREIMFNVNPNNPNVYRVEIWDGEVDLIERDGEKIISKGRDARLLARYVNGGLPDGDTETGYADLRLGLLSTAFKVNDLTTDYVKNHNLVHPFHIIVWAEDTNYAMQYRLRVRRAEPSNDAAMANLILKDGLNQVINTFLFHPDQFGCEEGKDDDLEPGGDTYYVSVPYSTKQVSFTPTTNHEFATVEIRDGNFTDLPQWDDYAGRIYPYLVESGATSRLFNLSDGWGRENAKEFHVIVRAEDYTISGTGNASGHQRTYCIKIYREPPSDDARLKSLVTQNTSNFKPQFISRVTDYTADVNEGAPGVIIIPTANHPGATIRVDGVVVQSGSPTDLIELLDITQTVHIEVIAEDGVTRMLYKITFTNQNLIEKTSNADLKNLIVNYGLMTPAFQAAVTEYEVTTKETVWSVDIIPKLADPLATMRVLNGTRELGDYNGNYAMAIADGQNDVSVEVTSPDGTVTKTYAVAIFRNDEEKLKNLTPLEAEDINFEQVSNPIIVRIEEYPRVGASVFNTLREEYPDYSIVFQGNDYSIRFDGKNLTRVIPQTEIYDFRMTYASPDEDAIYDLIAEYEYNDDIIDDVVMPYFDYHGSLPGPATFSLSLGRHYANDLLYWHYYNQERDRIDYYGTLQSNSQGNIAVSIDHFSTYVVAPEHRIAGSEDKDGVIDELGMVSNGQDLLSSGGKLNPDTGAAAAPGEGASLPDFGERPVLYTRKKEDP